MWPFRRKPPIDARARDKPRAHTAPSGRFRSVARTRADNTIRASEVIYAAVSRIANTVASMPLHLYQGFSLQEGHPLERLVAKEPNANFTPFTFLQTMEVCRNTEGNAYALIVPDRLGGVKRLDVLDPTRVRPQRHPETGELWYVVTLDDGASYPLPGCQLLTLHHMSANGELGIRPIDVLAGTLDYDKQIKAYSLDQLGGVNQGIFLTVPNTGLDEEGKDAVIDSFLAAYERSGQRVVILEGGLTAEPFKQSPVDAQVLDVERITRNRVATVYNIPPHMLGDYSDTSFSTAEQQMREFLQLTILPIAQQWEQELNRKLLTEKEFAAGYRFRFDVDALARADTATMADKYQKAIRGGWMRPNEVREREGLPPDENGGELMASRDLLPLHIAVQDPALLLCGQNSNTSSPTEN